MLNLVDLVKSFLNIFFELDPNSNEYSLFICNNRRRYSREPALQSFKFHYQPSSLVSSLYPICEGGRCGGRSRRQGRRRAADRAPQKDLDTGRRGRPGGAEEAGSGDFDRLAEAAQGLTERMSGRSARRRGFSSLRRCEAILAAAQQNSADFSRVNGFFGSLRTAPKTKLDLS